MTRRSFLALLGLAPFAGWLPKATPTGNIFRGVDIGPAVDLERDAEHVSAIVDFAAFAKATGPHPAIQESRRTNKSAAWIRMIHKGAGRPG